MDGTGILRITNPATHIRPNHYTPMDTIIHNIADEQPRRRVAVIGSTGSIGTQTVDIIRRFPHLFSATVLTAGQRVDDLIRQAKLLRPAMAVIADESKLPRLREALSPMGIHTAAGAQAIADAVTRHDVDVVLTATVGYSGLAPTIAAIRAGKDIALANKETLVVAGELIRALMVKSPSRIFPVDSEHSAIAQCLAGEAKNTVRSLIVTASGGPFLDWSEQQLQKATPADALRHPNWSMGDKITIDSATMMNKAFELIEAHFLFDIPSERIIPVVHPQSIIHSMVEFSDGAIKAQLGVPDMRLPIAYALCGHNRLDNVSAALTLAQMASLTFREPDTKRFPCLTLADAATKRGGNAACVINAANEIANLAFRQNRLPFGKIYPVIMETLQAVPYVAEPSYRDYVDSNAQARHVAAEIVDKEAM